MSVSNLFTFVFEFVGAGAPCKVVPGTCNINKSLKRNIIQWKHKKSFVMCSEKFVPKIRVPQPFITVGLTGYSSLSRAVEIK
jgi:hypothetical protein